MPPWLALERNVTLHISGGTFVELREKIAKVEPVVTAQFTDYEILGRDRPISVQTGLKAELSLSGILADDEAAQITKDFGMNDNRLARFMISYPKHNFMGPVGWININESSTPTQSGVIVIDSAAMATRKPGFERWRYGRLSGKNPTVPATRKNSPVASTIFTNPLVGQAAVLYVVKAGGLTLLELEYRHSSYSYEIGTKRKGGLVIAGLYIAQLIGIPPSSQTIPDDRLTGGQWRINRAGSVTRSGHDDAEYYIGMIDY